MGGIRFCGQDELHDPGEEYEEYLTCAVCGDNGKFWRRCKRLCQIEFSADRFPCSSQALR